MKSQCDSSHARSHFREESQRQPPFQDEEPIGINFGSILMAFALLGKTQTTDGHAVAPLGPSYHHSTARNRYSLKEFRSKATNALNSWSNYVASPESEYKEELSKQQTIIRTFLDPDWSGLLVQNKDFTQFIFKELRGALLYIGATRCLQKNPTFIQQLTGLILEGTTPGTEFVETIANTVSKLHLPSASGNEELYTQQANNVTESLIDFFNIPPLEESDSIVVWLNEDPADDLVAKLGKQYMQHGRAMTRKGFGADLSVDELTLIGILDVLDDADIRKRLDSSPSPNEAAQSVLTIPTKTKIATKYRSSVMGTTKIKRTVLGALKTSLKPFNSQKTKMHSVKKYWQYSPPHW